MKQIKPLISYDMRNENEYRRSVEQELRRCLKSETDLILTADDGSAWRLKVDSVGTLYTEAVP